MCNQPGELTVSWDAPDDSGQPHDLFSAGLNAAEHQRLLDTPAGMQFFTYLNQLSEPLRIPDFTAAAPEKKASPTPVLCPQVPSWPPPSVTRGLALVASAWPGRKESRSSAVKTKKLFTLFSSLAAIVIDSTRRFETGTAGRLQPENSHRDNAGRCRRLQSPVSGGPMSLNEAAIRIFKSLDPTNRHLKHIVDNSTVRWTDGQEMSLAEFVFAQLQPNKGALRAEELVLSVPGGRSLAVLVNTSLLRMQDDEVKSVVVTLQDLSWMEELEKLRAEFLGMVSHELRSPLASIKGSASNLRESLNAFSPDEMIQFIHIIEMQADRMRDLIRELLDVARIETGYAFRHARTV